MMRIMYRIYFCVNIMALATCLYYILIVEKIYVKVILGIGFVLCLLNLARDLARICRDHRIKKEG